MRTHSLCASAVVAVQRTAPQQSHLRFERVSVRKYSGVASTIVRLPQSRNGIWITLPQSGQVKPCLRAFQWTAGRRI